MRPLVIAGVVLALIGLWIIVRPPSYSREESVLKIGTIGAYTPKTFAVRLSPSSVSLGKPVAEQGRGRAIKVGSDYVVSRPEQSLGKGPLAAGSVENPGAGAQS